VITAFEQGGRVDQVFIIFRAHSRPSLIAQTTKDWPRRVPSAVKTLAILVW
jgi:hypothetical protein